MSINALGYYYTLPDHNTELSNYTAAEILSLSNVSVGTLLFNKTLAQLQYWDGTQWRTISEYPAELNLLTAHEITQLANINAASINSTQWGYLGAMDQPTHSATVPRFMGLELQETGAGTDTILLNAPAVLAAPYTLTLPVDDGTAGDLLQTDGAGVLTWSKNITMDNITVPRGPSKPVNFKGLKIYEQTFTLQGSEFPNPSVDPMVLLTFAVTTPWSARLRMVSADWSDDSNVAFLSAELSGGKGPVSALPQAIVVGNISQTGAALAAFSTEIAPTTTTVLLKKDSGKAAGTGNYSCTIYVEVFNGTLTKLTDGNTMVDIVTFLY